MLKIRPLGDRVVVRPEEEEETTEGGLYIPDTAKEQPQTGSVVSVGPGRVENGTRIEMTVHEGDRVLYGKYAGTEYGDLLIMREDDILGTLEE